MPEPTPAPLIQKIEMDAGALQAAWSFIAQKSNNAGCGWPEIAILGISPPLKYEGTQTAVAGAYARS